MAPVVQIEYSVLYYSKPGASQIPIGILVLPENGRHLFARLRRDWAEIAPPEEAEVLSMMGDHLRQLAVESGGTDVIRWLEDVASNTVCISDRFRMESADPEKALAQLFQDIVVSTTGSQK
jgi:hypothetical protein